MATAREDTGDFTALKDERARIANYLLQHMDEVLGEPQSILAKTTRYVLSAPGKLLRPLLLLDACRAAGGDPARVFPAACGTEYGHLASLIHDDIMDGDDTRRGRPTLHVQYTLPAAVLTGDLLIFETFLSFTDCTACGVEPERVVWAIRELSRTCIEMCQGQALEDTVSGHLETTEEMALEVIRLKTASFCTTAARIGAGLGGADQYAVSALAEYGHHVGMAFQIMDDLLCYLGDPSLMGKPALSDVCNGRVTLPIVFAMQSPDRGVRQRLRQVFALDGAARPKVHRELLHLLNVTRSLDRARAVAFRHTMKAQQALDRVPSTEASARLRNLANALLCRDH
jgi:geranylgeranyl pyrophosphate synthase